MPHGLQNRTGKFLYLSDEPYDSGGCRSLPTDFSQSRVQVNYKENCTGLLKWITLPL